MKGDHIFLCDVAPRDGLQNHPKHLTVSERLELITLLTDAGLSAVEVGSFVSSKAVPAMAHTDEVVRRLSADGRATYISLVPNFQGYQDARDAGCKSISMVLYGSESMARKNVNMSRNQVQEAMTEIQTDAKQRGIEVIATIGVAFECPFEGAVDPVDIEAIAASTLEGGADVVIVADTIGAANPAQVAALTESLVRQHGSERLGCHFHDTRAMGLANVYAAVRAGIRRFDASIAGLGGCPFAPGASGNVATEDVVMMLEQIGFSTGVDLDRLMVASYYAQKITGTAPGGRAKAWLEPWLAKRSQRAIND